MSWLNTIRNTKVPSPGEVLSIPKKIKTESKNQKVNSINVKYWDRHFRNPKTVIGTIDNKTSVPMVYFETPDKMAGIIFDDSIYTDEEGKRWIEFCEDYPYALDRNTDLAQFQGVEYYNNSVEKIPEGQLDYKIPMLLNRIPREIIRINTKEKLNSINKAYVDNKIEITKHILRQFGNIVMLERVGKKDNSFIITGILMGGSIGIIIGIFVSFAFLMN